ncbi:hypothetical protein SAMN05421833_12943 [Microbispora rosea]|uniref:Uncharacterized protein n=1 Tax=Microbispora rosea TaxID=58117 RepID=A0A1N7GI79_9ACTN|nr:hypothetical protein [Microbispora rosea]GIH51629.1 hypothetical protein Mro03_68080 [Microbispora rosea subsp. rosea]SIS12229.1 hypothetical protein SAMN05421833_12943 [Microbispora rosea]
MMAVRRMRLRLLTLSLAAHTVKANGRAFVWDIDPQANAYDLTSVMDSPG